MDFNAASVSVEEDEDLWRVAFADSQFNARHYLVLQRGKAPDAQDVELGLDGYSVEVNDPENACYGGVELFELARDHVAVTFEDDALPGLDGATTVDRQVLPARQAARPAPRLPGQDLRRLRLLHRRRRLAPPARTSATVPSAAGSPARPTLHNRPMSPAEASLREANRRFYDPMWTDARLVGPERFNTWPLVSELAARPGLRLEVGPGLRPRLPIEGTCFVDMSAPAVGKLRASGAHALRGFVNALPFADRTFQLVCALDIVEHVADEDGALSELARVAAPGATLLLSVPLHPAQWTTFDDFVGHCRRYEPDRLVAKLAEHGFAIERVPSTA